MIYEYALEPDLVAGWYTRETAKYIAMSFGLGTGRLVSRFPKYWKRLVWEAFTGRRGDLDQSRLEVLLSLITEVTVERRGAPYDVKLDWVTNARVEHARRQFRAILARSNPNNEEGVLRYSEIDYGTAPWEAPHGLVIKRRAEAIASALEPMLHCCSGVVLIDPHFRPQELRFRRPLEALLKMLVANRTPGEVPNVEIQTSGDWEAAAFQSLCASKLPSIMPAALKITIKILKPRDGGETLHNRHILTNLGGVELGAGLDEGDEGESEDLNLLARDQYLQRWAQYMNDPSAFDLVAPAFTIRGAA
jgi:hypothetical protein